MDTPESRGLNLCATVAVSGMTISSSSGLRGSKIGGSDGENAETGGVMLLVDMDERDELELPNSGSFKLAGESDKARPDFRPCDRDIEFPPSRLCWSPLLMRLWARYDVVEPIAPCDSRNFRPVAGVGIPKGDPNGSSSSSETGMRSSEIAFFPPRVGLLSASTVVPDRARSGCEVVKRGILDSCFLIPNRF